MAHQINAEWYPKLPLLSMFFLNHMPYPNHSFFMISKVTDMK